MSLGNDAITEAGKSSFQQDRFEELYMLCRNKENRVCTDEELNMLPSVPASHPHYHEWQVRKRSATRLLHYLENESKPLSILEAGCGNGWLSAWLASIKNASITGTDINRVELEQAGLVFRKKKNLKFIEGDIRDINWNDKKFDVIIFAASIQYFPSVKEIVQYALSILTKGGEVHILDSFFYAARDTGAAKQRSLLYYRAMGCEEMAAHYYHHSLDELKTFNYKLLFNPSSVKNKLFGKKDPFPWVCIRHS